MLTPREREELVASLMAAFVIHGMGEQVHLLQQYFAAASRGEEGAMGTWTDAYAVRWAMILQLPPYHEVLQVRPARSACQTCGDQTTHLTGTYPGGYVVKCGGCQTEWLVADDG